jgi:uncharacterized protein (DUF1684 family)
MSRLVFSALLLSLVNATAETPYQTSIEQWRQRREASLKADGGWLTVAGLFWLKEGMNKAGTDPSCDVILPRGPANAGVFEFHNGKTTFRSATGAATELKPDSDGGSNQVKLESLTMFVIHRGQRYGIRMKDTESKFRKEFTGLHWFPVNESYRITAKFVPNPPGKTIAVPNILGETEQEASPGYVLFTLNGQSVRLDPVVEGKELFFIFHDQTSGKETYPPGRFLYSDFAKDGKVELDFNKAYNPPCAFTPFATCPLPPKQNRLPIRIEAGELNYGHH